MRDLSDHIDDYCRKANGHSNWGYLDTYTKEDLASAEHTIEGNLVFWTDDFKDDEPIPVLPPIFGEDGHVIDYSDPIMIDKYDPEEED